METNEKIVNLEDLKVASDFFKETKADMIHETATGETITLTDSAEYPISGFTIYGKSTQDGTPTPESPVEIVNVVDTEVSVTSKNLFCTASKYGIDIRTGLVDTDLSREHGDDYVVVKPNSTYRISSRSAVIKTSTTSYNLWILGYDKDKNPVTDATEHTTYKNVVKSFNDSTLTSGPISTTLTTTPTTRYIRWYSTNMCVNYDEVKFLINKGEHSIPYEPYRPIQTRTIPHTLRSIPNGTVRDELEVDATTRTGTLTQRVDPKLDTQTTTSEHDDCILANPIVTQLPQSEVDDILSLTTYKPTTILSNDQGATMSVVYSADTKTVVDGKVDFTKAQELTREQRIQARDNINAATGGVRRVTQDTSKIIDLTPYTSSTNHFQCPCDGYLRLRGPASGVANASVDNYTAISAANNQYNMTFVAEGAWIFVGSTMQVAQFMPIEIIEG